MTSSRPTPRCGTRTSACKETEWSPGVVRALVHRLDWWERRDVRKFVACAVVGLLAAGCSATRRPCPSSGTDDKHDHRLPQAGCGHEPRTVRRGRRHRAERARGVLGASNGNDASRWIYRRTERHVVLLGPSRTSAVGEDRADPGGRGGCRFDGGLLQLSPDLHQSGGPKRRSPASPSPGTMNPLSLSSGSTAAQYTCTPGC